MDNEKIIEKHYIEVTTSKWHKFITGIITGLGYGIGITVGTALFLLLLSYAISKVNFVPGLGHFLSEVIKSAQYNLKR